MKLTEQLLASKGTKKFDVLGLGEVMLRLSPEGRERIVQGNLFEKRVGSSELSVISGVSVLGGQAGIITKLPDTEIGSFVINSMRSCGVSDRYVVRDTSDEARLGVYYYEVGSNPRKTSVVYDRKRSSVTTLKVDELPEDMFKSTRIFHTSGITLALCPELRATAKELMKRFKENGAVISFDVNFRASLWSEEESRAAITEILPLVDIFFVSEESSRRMFGKSGTLEEIMKSYCEEYGVRMVATTSREVITPNLHNFGSTVYSYDEDKFYTEKPYNGIEIVDRLGSGDAYVGGALFAMLEGLSFEGAMKYGNACSAIKNTIIGDLPAFSRRDVDRIISAHNSTGNQSEMNR